MLRAPQTEDPRPVLGFFLSGESYPWSFNLAFVSNNKGNISFADIFFDVASKIVIRVPYSFGKPARIANANSYGFMSEPAAVRFLYKSFALAAYMEIGSPDPNFSVFISFLKSIFLALLLLLYIVAKSSHSSLAVLAAATFPKWWSFMCNPMRARAGLCLFRGYARIHYNVLRLFVDKE
jgi:hypothetical protein